MLVWNETDVISALEAIPEVEEYETSYRFVIERNGLRLELTIFQYAGDVYFDLYKDGIEQSILSMTLIDCPGVRHLKDKRGEYLEFSAARTFGSRYDGDSPVAIGVRLTAKPHIRIALF